MTETTTPLNLCGLSNIGGCKRLRIAYSKDIVQQENQTETEIKRIIFSSAEKWVMDFDPTDNIVTDVKIEESSSDAGSIDNYNFKTVHETDTDRESFLVWWNKYIRNRRFAVELLNTNDITICINPFTINYIYVGKGEFENKNRYELTFLRAKLIENNNRAMAVIEKITSVARLYLGQPSNDVTINLLAGKSTTLFNFGYSKTSNFDSIIYQNNPSNNILYNIVDGTYYFFAVHKTTSIFDRVRATINGGAITITPEADSTTDYTGGDEADNAIFGNNTSE